jgi:hypothetical protein
MKRRWIANRNGPLQARGAQLPRDRSDSPARRSRGTGCKRVAIDHFVREIDYAVVIVKVDAYGILASIGLRAAKKKFLCCGALAMVLRQHRAQGSVAFRGNSPNPTAETRGLALVSDEKCLELRHL